MEAHVENKKQQRRAKIKTRHRQHLAERTEGNRRAVDNQPNVRGESNEQAAKPAQQKH